MTSFVPASTILNCVDGIPKVDRNTDPYHKFSCGSLYHFIMGCVAGAFAAKGSLTSESGQDSHLGN